VITLALEELTMQRYEIAIIGAGPAGYVGAIKAARAGAAVCIIEDSEFGGACLNTGCIPTKTLVASSRLLRHARRASEFGIAIDGSPAPDFEQLMSRKNKVVDIEKQGLIKLVESSGVEIINGRASFIDHNTLRIVSAAGTGTGGSAIAASQASAANETDIYAKNIIIATGSKPKALAFLPYDGKKVFSSDNIWALEKIPSSMLIIGGGYIGCEFASIFAPLGTKITILEALPKIVAGIDDDISDVLARELKKEGVAIKTGMKISGARVDDEVTVSFEDGSEISGDVALVSVGRRASSAGLNLEGIGVATLPNGDIDVNEQMMTSVPGVFAVGDVIGNPMLAHVASAECTVAVANALGQKLLMDYTLIPASIYTYPEIGTIGITEAQALEKGNDINVGNIQLRSLGISHAAGEIVGEAKIISDAMSDMILGVHIIGERAADIIHEAAVAMFQGMTASALGRVIHVHPTFSEVMGEAAQDVHGEAIYIRKKVA
jgi:dihydrolipoamide dehydrogenase